MPIRFGQPPEPEKAGPPQPTPVDTSKRYDVYCHEAGKRIVVYRNARFVDKRKLFSPDQKFDLVAEFYELEVATGKTIFISRMSIVKFCDTGIDPGAEVVASL